MNTILIAHPDIHIAAAVTEMMEAILEEPALSPGEIMVVTSLEEVMTVVKRVSLLLIDDDLFSETGIQEIREIPFDKKIKILIVEDQLLKIASELKVSGEIGNLISKPLERTYLKEMIRGIFL